MSDYDELTIEVKQGETPSRWDVTVRGPLVTLEESLTATVSQSDLLALRSATAWPDKDALIAIGKRVWGSLLTTPAHIVYPKSYAGLKGKKLRVAFVLHESDGSGANDVRIHELPVEALHGPLGDEDFLGLSLDTPISRPLLRPEDRSPATTIQLPLVVLVIIAAPLGKPVPNMAQERQAITEALAPLVQGGSVKLVFCESATRANVSALVASEDPHVVHFIGHGDFTTGEDGEDVPCLCFVHPVDQGVDSVDGGELAALLRESRVRLVVLNACGTAASSKGELRGVAQTLLTGVSSLTAAVAMQLDLDGWAAAPFSRAFYESFLRGPVDEAVLAGRRAIVGAASNAMFHRAWVTPVVFFRCKNAEVFDVVGGIGLTAAEQNALLALGVEADVLHDFLRDLAPDAASPSLAGLVTEKLRSFDATSKNRAVILREALRVTSVVAKRGEEAEITVLLHLGLQGIIDAFSIELLARDVVWLSADPASVAAVGPSPALVPTVRGAMLTITDPSGGAAWHTGEHAMAKVKIKVPLDAQAGLIDVGVEVKALSRGGHAFAATVLAGAVCVLPSS